MLLLKFWVTGSSANFASSGVLKVLEGGRPSCLHPMAA